MRYTANDLREVLVDATLKGGEMLRHYFGSTSRLRAKSSHYDLVTEADEKIEKELIEYIRRNFPDHVVIGEEMVSKNIDDGIRNEFVKTEDHDEHPWVWLVDPIDGTTNFIHKVPLVATSVAVLHRNRVIAGAVFNPIMDELFVAVKFEGATLNGRPLKVSREARLSESLLGTGYYYDAKKGQWVNVDLAGLLLYVSRSIRVIGSASLSLSYVASGRLSGYWELGLNPWDVAAGAIIVWEAGGHLTSVNGKPFDVWQRSVVATNGKIHAELVHALNKYSTVGSIRLK